MSSAPPRPRYHELEAYRGIAALLVVVFHAYQYSREGQQLGRFVYEGTPWHALFHNLSSPVAWFFALSGFLLFLPFASAAIRQTAPFGAREFLVRRAFRLLPLYYVAFLWVWLYRYSGESEQLSNLLAHLSFTHVLDARYTFATIGPAWSLAVEVMFCAMLAVLGPLAHRVCRALAPERRARVLAAGCAALVLASLAYKDWAHYAARIPDTAYPVWFGPLAQLDSFAAGMLVAAIAASVTRPLFAHLAVPVRLVALAIIAATFGLRHTSEWVSLYYFSLSGLAFALLVASSVLAPRGTTWERTLSHPLLAHAGLISYSVYLWHEPLLIELGRRGLLVSSAPEAFPANAAVLLIASVLVGTLSYHVVERTGMELRALVRRRPAATPARS